MEEVLASAAYTYELLERIDVWEETLANGAGGIYGPIRANGYELRTMKNGGRRLDVNCVFDPLCNVDCLCQ